MSTKDLPEKNGIAKHCLGADHNFIWDQEKVVDKESRLISRKIKETTNFLKNPNHINKISCKFPEIWLHNLNENLVYRARSLSDSLRNGQTPT